MSALVLAATLPGAVLGYGMDWDAFRSAQAAEQLWTTGVYHPSRLPGNPLFEYLLAPIVPWGGHITSNLVVFVSYPACVGIFSLLVKDRANRWLLTSLFALTPAILVNASTTMDYLPGLALMLGSFALARMQRYAFSGVLLGLSIGFRLSNGLFLIPMSLFLFLEHRRISEIVGFWVTSLVLGLTFYIPIVITEGVRAFLIPNAYDLRLYVFSMPYRALMLLGPIATAGILVLLLLRGRAFLESMRQAIGSRDSIITLEVTAVIAFTLLYAVHPDDTYYVLPIVPFVILLLARWFSNRQLLFLGALVLSFALFTVEFKGGESGRRFLTLEPSWGIIVKDVIDRKELRLLRSGVGQLQFSNRAVILTGMGAGVTYKNHALVRSAYEEVSPELQMEGIDEPTNIYRIAGQRSYLIYGLSRENVALLGEEGYEIYAFSEFAPGVAINYHDYDPFAMGIRKLNVFNEQSFYKK
jgi:hypothetical protein